MPRTPGLCIIALLAAVVAAAPGCGKGGGDRKRGAGPSSDGPDGRRASGPDAAPASARFLGFGQSADAKQRTVRLELAYHAARPAKAIRVRLAYQDAAGRPLGEFPLEIARPVSAPIASGRKLVETFDLMGHEGPPEAVTGIRIQVEHVTFVDDSTWTAPAPGAR